jgi:hypothetical protein
VNRRSVTRIRTSVDEEFDDSGNPVAPPDDEEADTVTVDGCLIAPRYSSEPDDRGRNGVVVGLTLYAPIDADIVRTDLIDVDGDKYSIEGEIGRWPGTAVGGLEIPLKRAVG